jgi:Pretoxin HINT domain
VAKALEIGLIAFLRLAGVNPDDFQRALDLFREFGDIVAKIALSPLTFARNLIAGATDGFADFGKGFPDNVKDAALQWLLDELQKGGLKLPALPNKFDVPSVTLFLLEFAGLTWKDIKAQLAERLPVGQVEKGLGIAQKLLGEPFSVDKVKEQLSAFNESVTNALEKLSWESITDWLQKNLPPKLAEWGVEAVAELVKLAIPGGAAIKGIWATVSFVIAQTGRLNALLAAVGGALKAAAELPRLVRENVLAGLLKLVQLVLGLLAELLKVDKLLQKVGQVLADFQCWIRKKVDAFFDWLLGRCGACRQKMGKGVSAGCPKATGSCFPRDGSDDTWLGRQSPAEVEVGWLVPTFIADERYRHPTSKRLPREREKLRVLACNLEKADGNGVAIRLLRRLEWLEEEGLVVGGLVWLHMPEMGVVGWAKVDALEECPPLPEGEGELVTGTFHHRWGIVYDLGLEGESKPVGTTATHPFWSVDREDWIPAGELRIGERLAARDGSTPKVLSFTQRPEPEPVFNIEVDGDHVYRVGEQGLLVHNMSQPNPAGGAGQAVPCGPPYPCDMPLQIQELGNREFSVARCADRDTLYNIRVANFRDACKMCNPGIPGMSVLSVAPDNSGDTCYDNVNLRTTHPYTPASPVLHITCGTSKKARANVSVFCCPCCDYQNGKAVVVWYCYCAKTTSS